MKRKTLTFAGKRYKKSKPSDLFIVSVNETFQTYDADGDLESDSTETRVKRQTMSLREVLTLIEDNYTTSEFDSCGGSIWFDSDFETSDYQTGEESKTSVMVDASQANVDRLEMAFCVKFKRRSHRLNRIQARKAAERRARFTCLSGDAWLARRSTADLRRVV